MCVSDRPSVVDVMHTDTKLLSGRWRGIRLGFLSSMKEYLS